jgi:hypothetical protein
MEKVTHNNARSNGETSFHHVMMKMIPDAEGSLVNFTDRTPVTIADTVDLTGTNVEEWNDLIVSVFVQDHQSKKVYQSAYSIENGILGNEARLETLTQGGQPVNAFSPNTFSYNVTLPTGTILVPEVVAEPMDTNAIVIIVPAYVLPGSTTVDVFAENLKDHNQYVVNFLVPGVGVNDPVVSPVSVYPNPTKGTLYLLNADHSKVTVTGNGGLVVYSVSDFTGTTIDLGNQAPGIYILSVERADHSILKKKIVLY